MSAPIRLTDSQLDVVMAAAQPIAPVNCGLSLEAVAAGLRGHEVGDGLLHGVIAQAQHRYFDPPMLERKAGHLKWR
jgi:hypothetical protein